MILTMRRKTQTRKQEHRRKYEIQKNEKELPVYIGASDNFECVNFAQNQ